MYNKEMTKEQKELELAFSSFIQRIIRDADKRKNAQKRKKIVQKSKRKSKR